LEEHLENVAEMAAECRADAHVAPHAGTWIETPKQFH